MSLSDLDHFSHVGVIGNSKYSKYQSYTCISFQKKRLYKKQRLLSDRLVDSDISHGCNKFHPVP